MIDKNTNKWPRGALYVRISPNQDPFDQGSVEIYKNQNFNIEKDFEKNIEFKLTEIFKKTLSKLQLHAIFLPGEYRRQNPAVTEDKIVQSIKLTLLKVPDAATFNLMADDKKVEVKKTAKKAPHIKSKIYLTIIEDILSLPLQNLPPEIIHHLRFENVNGKHYYYPIFTIDDMSSRIKDLLEVCLPFIYNIEYQIVLWRNMC